MAVSSKKELDRLCGSDSHQGVVALLNPRERVDIDDFIRSNNSELVVALDSINDPHNLGAILRAAECLGVGLVIWSKNRELLSLQQSQKLVPHALSLFQYHCIESLNDT